MSDTKTASVHHELRVDVNVNGLRAGSHEEPTARTTDGIEEQCALSLPPNTHATSIVEWARHMLSIQTLIHMPPLVRALLVVLPITSVLAWYPPFLHHFGLCPGYTLGKLHLWNVVTYGFIESSQLNLFVSSIILSTVGRMVERSWADADRRAPGHHETTLAWNQIPEGSFQLAYYLTLVTTLCGLVVFIGRVGIYFLFSYDAAYLFTSTTGFNASVSALLVALARTMPNRIVSVGNQGWAVPIRLLAFSYVIFMLP